MTIAESLIAFSIAAGLLTLTPGLDTALMLRTAAVEGPKRAAATGAGILTGCLVWGAAVAIGLGALLTASEMAFTLLKWAGAAYLVWMGAGMILKPRRTYDPVPASRPPGGSPYPLRAGEVGGFNRGLMTNLLNPKVGVFYVSFLPQFVPDGVAAGPWMFGLAGLHAAMGAVWFVVLVAATLPLAGLLHRPGVVTWLDRITGGVLIGFAVKLALARR
ncbi:threonine/homoserine/homoserine lactone efflux protein [Caulobacter ginsengisoli]|uniref:Threonine/homoserine/homoserine lactone efflux protein n=1 Tax=Caulobacter ginsengisoli TaxID=400775 RepID=A0ABU0IWF9_9CAUL|nr:LysE family translocator [Caulobacter ginsengisoli]MDQ0466343.1 threonine/homoserine/homoserine lactone efflux protein [Caulobacter ginsengisoli]